MSLSEGFVRCLQTVKVLISTLQFTLKSWFLVKGPFSSCSFWICHPIMSQIWIFLTSNFSSLLCRCNWGKEQGRGGGRVENINFKKLQSHLVAGLKSHWHVQSSQLQAKVTRRQHSVPSAPQPCPQPFDHSGWDNNALIPYINAFKVTLKYVLIFKS